LAQSWNDPPAYHCPQYFTKIYSAGIAIGMKMLTTLFASPQPQP